MVPTPPAARKRRLSAEARRSVIEESASAVFGVRGYHGASLEEIARRSGVSVPVIYDHFPSKRALFEDLLAKHFAELRNVWASAGSPDGPDWFPGVVDDWFAYVQERPFAARLLFQETTGDPDIAGAHQRIRTASRAELLPALAAVLPALAADGPIAVELVWEGLRATMQGLAIWWSDHPEVPRSMVVDGVLNTAWTGLERLATGV